MGLLRGKEILVLRRILLKEQRLDPEEEVGPYDR